MFKTLIFYPSRLLCFLWQILAFTCKITRRVETYVRNTIYETGLLSIPISRFLVQNWQIQIFHLYLMIANFHFCREKIRKKKVYVSLFCRLIRKINSILITLLAKWKKLIDFGSRKMRLVLDEKNLKMDVWKNCSVFTRADGLMRDLNPTSTCTKKCSRKTILP